MGSQNRQMATHHRLPMNRLPINRRLALHSKARSITATSSTWVTLPGFCRAAERKLRPCCLAWYWTARNSSGPCARPSTPRTQTRFVAAHTRSGARLPFSRLIVSWTQRASSRKRREIRMWISSKGTSRCSPRRSSASKPCRSSDCSNPAAAAYTHSSAFERYLGGASPHHPGLAGIRERVRQSHRTTAQPEKRVGEPAGSLHGALQGYALT
jgi:hypothetical protein